MVDSQFRHPRLVALLVFAALVVALGAVMGPRGGGIAGVSDAVAEENPEPESTSTSTDPNYDDGVIFTTPGVLDSVVEGSAPDPVATATGGVTVTSTPPETVATTAVPPTASPSPTTTTLPPERSEVPTTTTPTDEQVSVPSQPVVDPVVPVVITGDELVGTGVSFDDLTTVVGSAQGSPARDDVLGQLGTRDANSTPWMLLIGANFLVAGGALVALRLRR